MLGEPDEVPALAQVGIPEIEQGGYRAYPFTDHRGDRSAVRISDREPRQDNEDGERRDHRGKQWPRQRPRPLPPAPRSLRAGTCSECKRRPRSGCATAFPRRSIAAAAAHSASRASVHSARSSAEDASVGDGHARSAGLPVAPPASRRLSSTARERPVTGWPPLRAIELLAHGRRLQRPNAASKLESLGGARERQLGPVALACRLDVDVCAERAPERGGDVECGLLLVGVADARRAARSPGPL